MLYKWAVWPSIGYVWRLLVFCDHVWVYTHVNKALYILFTYVFIYVFTMQRIESILLIKYSAVFYIFLRWVICAPWMKRYLPTQSVCVTRCPAGLFYQLFIQQIQFFRISFPGWFRGRIGRRWVYVRFGRQKKEVPIVFWGSSWLEVVRRSCGGVSKFQQVLILQAPLANSNPRSATVFFFATYRGSGHKEPTASNDNATSYPFWCHYSLGMCQAPGFPQNLWLIHWCQGCLLTFPWPFHFQLSLSNVCFPGSSPTAKI